MCRCVFIFLLALAPPALSQPASDSDILRWADLVGRYAAEISMKGASVEMATIEIDTTVDSVRIRCVDQHSVERFQQTFSRARTQLGAIGGLLSAVRRDTTVNFWFDLLSTGQLRGRLQYITGDPPNRSITTFQTVSSVGALRKDSAAPPSGGYQSLQRPCSYRPSPNAESCGQPTVHPTGLCTEHVR